MVNRRGQVVVFFLLAIVLLFSMFFMFYLVNQSQSKQLQDSLKQIEDESLVRDRVYQNVQGCFSQATTSGLKILGRHAGYIPNGTYQLPSGTDDYKSFYVDGNIVLTSSNYVKDGDDKYLILIKKTTAFDNEKYPLNRIYENYKIDDVSLGLSSTYKPNEVQFCKKVTEGVCDTNFDKEVLNCDYNQNETHCYNSVQASLERYIKEYYFSCIEELREGLMGYTLFPESIENLTIDSFFAKTTIEFFVESETYLISNLTNTRLDFPRIRSDPFNIGLKAFYDGTFRRLMDLEKTIPSNNLLLSLSEKLDDYGGSNVNLHSNTRIKNYYLIEINLSTLIDPIGSGISRYYGGVGGETFVFRFAVESRVPVLEGKKNFVFDSGEHSLKLNAINPDKEFGGKLHFFIINDESEWTLIKPEDVDSNISHHTINIIGFENGDYVSVCDFPEWNSNFCHYKKFR